MVLVLKTIRDRTRKSKCHIRSFRARLNACGMLSCSSALRDFVAFNQPSETTDTPGLALADAALLWGRQWRQGIPYSSMLLNSINHPSADGMRIFVTALLELFKFK